jgi:hypothetical protein
VISRPAGDRNDTVLVLTMKCRRKLTATDTMSRPLTLGLADS